MSISTVRAARGVSCSSDVVHGNARPGGEVSILSAALVGAASIAAGAALAACTAAGTGAASLTICFQGVVRLCSTNGLNIFPTSYNLSSVDVNSASFSARIWSFDSLCFFERCCNCFFVLTL